MQSSKSKSKSKTLKRNTLHDDILGYVSKFLDSKTKLNLTKTKKNIYTKLQPNIKKDEYMKLINYNKYYIVDVEYIINEFIPFLTYSINNDYYLNIWNFKNNDENKKKINILNDKNALNLLTSNNLQYIIDIIIGIKQFMSIKSENINDDFFYKLKTFFNIFSKKSSLFINNSKKAIKYREIVEIIKHIFFLFKQIIDIHACFIQLNIYQKNLYSINNNFINFIEKYFDIELYNEFVIDTWFGGDYFMGEDSLLDEQSKYILVFTDIKHNPLVFYYKQKKQSYYLNPTRNTELYNIILERLNLV